MKKQYESTQDTLERHKDERHVVVFPSTNGTKWKVKRSRSKKALKIFDRREVAFIYACQIAYEGELVVVMNNLGSIEFTFEVEDWK